MKEIIVKYLQEEASKEDKERLLEWIRENEDNKKTFAQLRDIWIKTEYLSSLTSNPRFVKESFERFTQRVNDLGKNQKKIYLRSFMKIAASVAILITCVTGGYFLGDRISVANQEALSPTVMNHVLMGKDSKGSVTLPDGTRVWMNSNSKLIYPENFIADSRTVKQEGECYFEVVPSKEIPFYIETGGMKIKVLGTKLNVKNNKKSLETVLISGKIEVFLSNNQESVVLEPNQKISKDKESNEVLLSEVDALEHIIWINDELVFNNEYLLTILRKMKYWYGLDLQVSKKIDTAQRLSLTIRKESLEEILKLIELICPIKYTINGDVVLVTHY